MLQMEAIWVRTIYFCKYTYLRISCTEKASTENVQTEEAYIAKMLWDEK